MGQNNTMVNTFLPALLLFVRCGGTVAEHLNVYDEPIQTCSQDGTALTGWTRSGSCVDHDDDSGSHHICIDLSSTASAGNFCTVTGQSDWCSSTDMPCHEDPNSGECAIEHWCVCQWPSSLTSRPPAGAGASKTSSARRSTRRPWTRTAKTRRGTRKRWRVWWNDAGCKLVEA